MADTLLDSLERTRAGYAKECDWLTFLTDAYTGGGGFEGKTQLPPSGYWGRMAEMYAAVQPYWLGVKLIERTYLDKHLREDEPKFQSRKAVSHYLNYVEPLTDLKCSYLLRKPFNRPDELPQIGAWRQDIDGSGATWDDVRPGIVLRAAVGGWSPVLLDRPPAPGVMSLGQLRDAGLDHFIVNQLAPGNLLEWSERGGQLEWVKIRTTRTEIASWDSVPATIEEYTVWTRGDATRWIVTDGGSGKPKSISAPITMPHPFGRVPLVVFRHKRSPSSCDSSLFGLPMHAQISTEARRLFNLVSELDEHIRGQVFAILVMVGSVAVPQNGEQVVGVENGLTQDISATRDHYFLAPPSSVATTLENRLEATVKEMYRMARAEYTRPVGAPTSGVARRYEFASTNRAIADFGSEIARGEQDIAQLVAIGVGVAVDVASKQRVTAPDDFDIDDLESDIKNVMDAVSAGLGPTATAEIKRALVQRLIPQIKPVMLKSIEAEIKKAEETKAAAPPPTFGPPPINPPAPPA